MLIQIITFICDISHFCIESETNAMIHPSIKSYHQDRRHPMIAPLNERSYFLGQNVHDLHKYPRVNILKEGALFEMEVALPGFKKSEIMVMVADNILTIRAERSKEVGMDESKYVLHEFGHDRLERKFKLSRGIGHEKIHAKFLNGILTLTFIDVPEEEEREYQRIEVL